MEEVAPLSSKRNEVLNRLTDVCLPCYSVVNQAPPTVESNFDLAPETWSCDPVRCRYEIRRGKKNKIKTLLCFQESISK